ncbi:MAG: L-histidine N(alpha)-methyltransferase [Anaerolineales bacterium]|nr:L-histidine N(alpha)-methyltransferase [Anaerolineales bacterium]
MHAVPGAHAVPTLAEDVAHGFEQRPRRLPPKYFYDAHGSALFDRICDTPEYYPTRSEHALLAEHADALVERVRPDHIIELGSGTARKTLALLAGCERVGLAPVYWPFDVCSEVVEQAAGHLQTRLPWLRVEGLVGDYTAGLDHLPRPVGRTLYVFLGGTFGNFDPAEGRALLSEVAGRMGPNDALLLGVDRVKERSIIEAAYNDAAGVTAAFNRNVLEVINRELDADFEPDAFRHEAVFNEPRGQLEMYLRAERDMSVECAALARQYRFAADEPLLTEISRKFTDDQIEREIAAAGLRRRASLVAPGDYFALELLERPP